VSFAGATLQVVGARLAAGATAPVAIRQHDIELSTQTPANPQNTLKARVTRQVFLGATRDYLVEVADGMTLRVVTSPDIIVAEGGEVWLILPPERCLALSR
jgi:iron(III) transport system ATP-binding protein